MEEKKKGGEWGSCNMGVTVYVPYYVVRTSEKFSWGTAHKKFSLTVLERRNAFSSSGSRGHSAKWMEKRSFVSVRSHQQECFYLVCCTSTYFPPFPK